MAKSVFNILLIIFLTRCSLSLNIRSEPDDEKVSPAVATTNKLTRKLALSQTQVARNLFYSPNRKMKSYLSQVASAALDFLKECQVQDLSKLLRVFQKGGYIGKGEDSYAEFVEVLNRIKASHQSGTDIAAMFNLLGDVGTLLCTPEEYTAKTKAEHERVVEVISRTFNIPVEKLLREGKRAKKERATVAGPNKKKERANGQLKTRKGILNSGEQADLNLAKINHGQMIKEATWPDQLIPRRRIINSIEPWAGHISGSATEIMYVLDILTHTDPMVSYDSKINPNLRLRTIARQETAAITSAFFIGLGYHSALELIETIEDYLGTDYRKQGIIPEGKDVGDVPEQLHATEVLDKLMGKFIDSKNKVSPASKKFLD